MPYLSLLNKIQQSGVDALKALRTLYEKGFFSHDCILMIDEIYLQKSAQYQSGEYVGVGEEENLGKFEEGIVEFMVVGLKQSIPFVVQAIPEVTFNWKWQAEKFSDSIDNLIEIRLCVPGIVTDNHSANINVFLALMSGGNKRSYIYIYIYIYLDRPAAYKCRFVLSIMNFCYHQALKG